MRYRNSGYSEGGASHRKPALKTYQPQHLSAKSDIDMNLRTLRNRSADLAMNNPIGAAAINTQATQTIGSGLKLFPRLKYKELGLTADQARDWASRTKSEFNLWSKNLRCDYTERNNFYEMQRIAYLSYLIDGDAFCLFRRSEPSREFPYSLRLQLLEAQRVSNPQDGGVGLTSIEMQGTTEGSRIINGIEVSREGRVQAIWVSNKIWNEPGLEERQEWRRVRWYGLRTGKKNILHICADNRIEQYRGVPYLAPVIETLRNIGRYSEAELSQAIIKSFFSVFFTQQASNFNINEIVDEELDVSEYRLGSGTISALPRGVDVKAIDSSNAQNTFDAFLSTFTRQVGAALNIPYELLMKQFQSSYSASRAALLQAEDEFRQRRQWFIQDFCAPVYEQFLVEAVATGRIEAKGFFDDPLRQMLWSQAEWYSERSHGLDVEKEVEGAARKVELGLSTLEKEAAELTGTDYYENIDALRDECKIKEWRNEEVLEHRGE